MKVIKHGNKFKQKTLKGTCNKCHCHVEVTPKETKTLIDRDTTSGMATEYVKCPECNNTHLWVK